MEGENNSAQQLDTKNRRIAHARRCYMCSHNCSARAIQQYPFSTGCLPQYWVLAVFQRVEIWSCKVLSGSDKHNDGYGIISDGDATDNCKKSKKGSYVAVAATHYCVGSVWATQNMLLSVYHVCNQQSPDLRSMNSHLGSLPAPS